MRNLLGRALQLPSVTPISDECFGDHLEISLHSRPKNLRVSRDSSQVCDLAVLAHGDLEETAETAVTT